MIKPDNNNELINQLRSKNLLICTDGISCYIWVKNLLQLVYHLSISMRYTDKFKPRRFYWDRHKSGVDVYILKP